MLQEKIVKQAIYLWAVADLCFARYCKVVITCIQKKNTCKNLEKDNNQIIKKEKLSHTEL